jgi:CHAT domain-containing protein
MMGSKMQHERTNLQYMHTVLVGFLLLISLHSCSSDKKTDPRYLLRDLPEDIIHHILSSDDSTFTRYGRKAGFVVISDANKILNNRIYNLFKDGHDSEALALLTHTKRIARILAYEYQYSSYLDRLNFIENLSPEDRTLLMEKELEYYAFRDEVHLPASQKLAKYSQLLDIFKKYQDVEYIALCEYEISYAHQALGNEDAEIQFLRSACANFAKCGLHEMTFPVLGELGIYHQEIGQIDSMIYYFEQAKLLAHRSRLPLETAQITSLYSEYYAGQGRLSLAYDLIVEAMEICRKFKGEYEELRYIIETMSFQADLNCWEIVERLLRRARVLQSKYDDDPEKYFELYSLQIDRIDGRLKMAAGNVPAAETMFTKTKQAIDNLNMPYTREPETARLYLFWSQGLLDNGLANEALRIIRNGFRLSQESQLTEFKARFSLLTAATYIQLGDLDAADQALEQFDSIALDNEMNLQSAYINRDAIQGSIALARGDKKQAAHHLETGLNRMKQFFSVRDAGVQSYLKIGECDALYQLMNDLTSHDPIVAYGAELLWQDFNRLLGGEASSGNVPLSLDGRIKISLFEVAAGARNKRLAELGVIHIMYAIHGKQIKRWTVASNSIHCDTLDVTTDGARILVNDTWKMLAPGYSKPEMVSSTKLAVNLRMLADMLLPPLIRNDMNAPSDETLLITADDFLSRIPFEAFDVGAGDNYTPLLIRHNVAYLRDSESSERWSNTNPGVILVNDKLSTDLRKRYPFQQSLPQALIEAETMSALEPNGILLTGTAATKSKLLSLWESAPFIYLVTHTLRDPQVPYLMLIPLIEPQEMSAPDAAYLDFCDIRTADFSQCELVVLSGCSSGAPYVNDRNAGPSLGDAFLDAGAGAVIQTFWDVKDDEAKQLMTLFIPVWRSGQRSQIQALCDARRTLIQKSDGVRHLSRWAPFFIKLGEL